MDLSRAAQEAYDAYCGARHIEKPMLPSWGNLDPALQQAWKTALAAGIEVVKEEIGEDAVDLQREDIEVGAVHEARNDFEKELRDEYKDEIRDEVRTELRSEIEKQVRKELVDAEI